MPHGKGHPKSRSSVVRLLILANEFDSMHPRLLTDTTRELVLLSCEDIGIRLGLDMHLRSERSASGIKNE
jgi:hypothetical protein